LNEQETINQIQNLNAIQKKCDVEGGGDVGRTIQAVLSFAPRNMEFSFQVRITMETREVSAVFRWISSIIQLTISQIGMVHASSLFVPCSRGHDQAAISSFPLTQ